jgi:hypothetical protein
MAKLEALDSEDSDGDSDGDSGKNEDEKEQQPRKKKKTEEKRKTPLFSFAVEEVAMVLLRRFGKNCLTKGLNPTNITKKLLSLKKIELGEDEEGFADVEARVHSMLGDNMKKVFTQHQSKAGCFCLSGKGQKLATDAVQDL